MATVQTSDPNKANQNQQQERFQQQPRPNNNLPFVQQGQLLQAVAPMQQTAPQTPQGQQQQLLQTAGQQALGAQQQPQPIMQQVQQGAQQLLQQPLGFDPEKQVQNQLAQFDVNRAKAQDAFQQQTADTARTGANLEKAFNLALRGARERTDLERTAEADLAREALQARVAALGVGQDVAQTQAGLDQQRFGQLIQAAQGFDPGIQRGSEQEFAREQADLSRVQELLVQSKDIAGNEALTRLQADLESDRLMTQQEFAGTQAALDRALTTAENAGDRASAEAISRMKADLDAQMQDKQIRAQQELQRMQIDADQWQTDRAEALTRAGWDVETARDSAQKEHERFTQAYDAELRKQLQSGAIEADAAEKALDRAVTVSEASLDRQLNREVEEGRIGIEEARMAQQATQFDSQQDFEREMADLGFEQEQITRAWESGERAADRAHESQMQVAENEFRDNWNRINAELQQQEIDNSFNIANAQLGLSREEFLASKDQFEKEFGLSEDQFDEHKAQFEESIGLQRDQLTEDQRQANEQLAIAKEQLKNQRDAYDWEVMIQASDVLEPDQAAEFLRARMIEAGVKLPPIVEPEEPEEEQAAVRDTTGPDAFVPGTKIKVADLF